MNGFFMTCECGRDLERCDDCGEWLCWQCDGAEHERDHRDVEREREARHRDIELEYGYDGYDRDPFGW